jgi:hypothetical protein
MVNMLSARLNPYRPSKIVYTGLEGSGKSLLMARQLHWNIYRNHYWQRKTKIPRPIYYNLAVGDKIIKLAEKLEVPLIYWSNLWDLTTMTECDLYIDELATYFDSRSYADLPLEVRLWLAQAEKLGVEIVGATQDYFMIDKSYRRLVKQLHETKKIAGSMRPKKSAPQIKRHWAWFFVWELDALSAGDAESQQQIKQNGIFSFPTLKRLTKSDITNFHTNVRVQLSKPPPLKKVTRQCPEDGYTRVRYI